MSTICPGVACDAYVRYGWRLCEDCAAYLPEVLADIGPLWHQAATLLPASSRMALEHLTGGGVGSRPPVNLAILSTLDTAREILRGWAQTIAIREDQVLPFRSAEHPVDAALKVLTAQWHTLSRSSLFGDFYQAMYGVRMDLYRFAGDDPPVQRIMAPCPGCDHVALVRRPDKHHIVCMFCGAQWSQAQFAGLLRRRNQADPKIVRSSTTKGEPRT